MALRSSKVQIDFEDLIAMPYRSLATRLLRALAALSLISIALPSNAGIIPDSDPWEHWRPAAETPQLEVDHSGWAQILATYLDAEHPSGINRFDYRSVTAEDRAVLDGYVAYLASLPVAQLTREQQQAYWINLYNAITVQLILDHPEVSSIRKIKDGFFSIGPWGRDVVEVDGKTLTLNDIEHRILRPLYGDARVHFAVNCASLGCPNLQPEPWTADQLESMYDAGARAFINHPRGVSESDRKLRLSSIFSWFDEDFGDDRRELLDWLAQYAEPDLAATLRSWNGPVRFDYDWALNAPE